MPPSAVKFPAARSFGSTAFLSNPGGGAYVQPLFEANDMVASDAHPLKAELPTLRTVDGIDMRRSLSHPSNASASISSSPSDSYTEAREAHPENAPAFILSTEPDISTEEREAHPANAS